MKTLPQQPEETKVTTKHLVIYKGFNVTINGKHELKFAKKSKMDFGFWVESEMRGVNFGSASTKSLREKLDCLVKTITEAKEYKEKSDSFRGQHENLSVYEKITHKNFAYARFQNSSYGNYYNIYWKSQPSPTGVELVGGCTESEWETISKQTGNTHNYYSPTENKMTAH